jgi:hypothetical protein
MIDYPPRDVDSEPAIGGAKRIRVDDGAGLGTEKKPNGDRRLYRPRFVRLLYLYTRDSGCSGSELQASGARCYAVAFEFFLAY